MKRTTIFLIVALMVLTLAPSVFADYDFPTVGDRLFLHPSGDLEFPAGDAFHVRHGFSTDPSTEPVVGMLDFVLEIDGVVQKPSFRYVDADPRGDNQYWILRQTIYNFPEGMTGTHTFKGHWYVACKFVYSKEDCPLPNKPTEIMTTTVNVTFTTPPYP